MRRRTAYNRTTDSYAKTVASNREKEQNEMKTFETSECKTNTSKPVEPLQNRD